MKKQDLKEYNIVVGEIGISFVFEQNLFGNKIKFYKNEFTADNNRAETKLTIHRGNICGNIGRKKVFDSETNWSLYGDDGKYILQDCSFDSSTSPEKLIILASDFKSGDIYLTNEAFYQKSPFDLLRHTLIQTLMVILLSRGKGVMQHACGVDDSGNGYLFVGRSGHGKSTIAKLWSKKCVTVLNDDRMIVRKIDGRFWIYGTPWHGDAKICSPDKAPLKKIFFLKHDKKNSAKKITPMEVTSHLVARSFPTFWDKKGMEFTLSFCSELAQKVPSYELGFVPDYSAIDFIKNQR